MHGLLIAEKPSVKRAVEAVYKKEAGKLPFTLDFAAFHGHLMQLLEPADYNPAWSDWSNLPVIPDAFRYKADDVKSVNELTAKIKQGNYDFVVNACDAGREGEHIFWSFYETQGFKLPVKRFWVSSVTAPALKKALSDLRDYKDYEGLRQSAAYRAQLDWLVGMNFTRAATNRKGETTSIGRVQTPVLKLIVDRELQIRNFKPEDFYEVKGVFKVNGVDFAATHMFVRSLKKTVIAETDEKAEENETDVEDYVVDEKARTSVLTARGIKKAEQFFHVKNLSDPENSTISHHINQAIKAHGVMKKDIDYVIKDGQIVIVDEFTGRLMFGRRYSEGLHQAIEAKERVKVERESKTLSTITFQNYFRLYNKLSGMTGTALTEEEEFGSIYKLDIIEIPTNLPVARQDNNDIVYKTEDAKYQSVIEQIKLCHAKGQPVLVGTVSIDKSERLSKLLKKEGIPHNVLNAKNHEQEAEIVAQAGKWGAVTVATNMAGRGTDIMLGGNAEFLAKTDLREMGYTDELIAEATGYAETVDEEILSVRKQFADCLQKYKKEIEGEAEKVRGAGGLFIIGTERHDSRRIDNQLRGRAGRQGDPGETRFYLSLEDDLIRLFGGDRITSLMEKMDIPDDMPIENKMLTKAIMNAQISVESRNFQARKSTLEYDDVMNKQREIVYSQRRQVLDGRDIRDVITGMIASIVSHTVQNGFSGQNHLDDEGYKSIMSNLEGLFFPKYAIKLTQEEIFRISAEDLTERITVKALETYDNKEREVTPPVMREVERVFMLRTVDEYWMEHIDAMQELRQGIRLRAYAQSNPVDAYKQESLTMFDEMIAAIQEDTVRRLYFFRVQKNVV